MFGIVYYLAWKMGQAGCAGLGSAQLGHGLATPPTTLERVHCPRFPFWRPGYRPVTFRNYREHYAPDARVLPTFYPPTDAPRDAAKWDLAATSKCVLLGLGSTASVGPRSRAFVSIPPCFHPAASMPTCMSRQQMSIELQATSLAFGKPNLAGGCGALHSASPGAAPPTPTSRPPSERRHAPCCWWHTAAAAQPTCSRVVRDYAHGARLRAQQLSSRLALLPSLWPRCRRSCCSVCCAWLPTRSAPGSRALRRAGCSETSGSCVRTS